MNSRPHTLVQLFRQAKDPLQKVKLAAQLYASGGSLDRKTEGLFFNTLLQNGQSDLAIRIWQSSPIKDLKWRSTGCVIYAHTNNIMAAEALASKGVDEYASKILRGAQTRQLPLRSGIELLRTRSAKSPAHLASVLASRPDYLDDQESILRALSISKIKDDPFWRQNHSETVKDELLHQGIAPSDDTELTMGRCLSLMKTAIRQNSMQTAVKLFSNRPQGMDDTCKGRELKLIFFAYAKQWRPLFDVMLAPKLSWHNWRLVWRLLAEMCRAPPVEQLPNPRELWLEMTTTRGFPRKGSTLLDVFKVFHYTKDYAFLLAALQAWSSRTKQKLPPQLIHYLCSLKVGSVAQLESCTPREIVMALCRQNDIDFAIVEQNSLYLTAEP